MEQAAGGGPGRWGLRGLVEGASVPGSEPVWTAFLRMQSNSDAHGLRIPGEEALCGVLGEEGRPRPDLHSRFRWGPLSLEAQGPRHACPTHRSASADPADKRCCGDASPPPWGSPRPRPHIITLMGTPTK